LNIHLNHICKVTSNIGWNKQLHWLFCWTWVSWRIMRYFFLAKNQWILCKFLRNLFSSDSSAHIIFQPLYLLPLLFLNFFLYHWNKFQMYIIIESMLSFKAFNTITRSFGFAYLLSTGKQFKQFKWKADDNKNNK
jgi:hypothetical protein